MIQVAAIDHNPIVLAGLFAMLDPEPDVAVVGAAVIREEIHPLMYRTRPDVVIVEEAEMGGIAVCQAIKSQPPCAKVIVSVETANPMMIAAAILAEADAVVDSAASARELLEAVRGVMSGPTMGYDFTARERRRIATVIDRRDLSILGMKLAGTPVADIANALGETPSGIRDRIQRMIAALRGGGAAVEIERPSGGHGIAA